MVLSAYTLSLASCAPVRIQAWTTVLLLKPERIACRRLRDRRRLGLSVGRTFSAADYTRGHKRREEARRLAPYRSSCEDRNARAARSGEGRDRFFPDHAVEPRGRLAELERN